MLNSTGLCQTLPTPARLCLVLFESADSGKISGASGAGKVNRVNGISRVQPAPAESADSCRLQQTQRTLIWLSILARTLALVQSLSLDSRTASSLWPYPPTIDRTLSIIVCGRG